MAKKKSKEISLDDLEEELVDTDNLEEEEDEIEEIEEFSLDEISEEEEVSEVFEEELEEFEELEEEAPKEEIVDERIYIIPLAKARRGPRNKWAKKGVRYLREFMERHFKPESLVISQEVNEAIWARGIQKPPRKIKIRATKNIDGLVVCYLAE
ncbi:MAG: 50S ribosomal protein L31e [Candidatus Hermodarchaeota archaeon]